jgi:hypothetical protein
MVPENVDGYKNEWVLYSEYYIPGNPIYQKRYDDRVNLQTTLVLVRDKFPLDVLSGKAVFMQTARTPIDHEYVIRAIDDSDIKENTFYFPGWKVIVDGKEIPINYEDKNNFGLITFRLKRGLHKVKVVFEDTPVRRLGKDISLASLILLLTTTPFLFSGITRRKD